MFVLETRRLKISEKVNVESICSPKFSAFWKFVLDREVLT